ncbi:MAG: RecB-like helicase [Campylobacterales bacterium]|nr:RecB-like helicase [Campylobacterales bacterium]
MSDNFKNYFAYSASAGSGKTFALSVRYVALLFMGESPSSILAATFTKKAATEMRERVFGYIRDIDAPKNRFFLDKVAKQSGLSIDAILAKKETVQNRFLAQSGYIVTIDSFFASIVRSLSFEVGLEPGFEMGDIDVEEVLESFLSKVISKNDTPHFMTLLRLLDDRHLGKVLPLMQDFYKIDPILPKIEKPPVDIQAIEKEIEKKRLAMIELLESLGTANRAIKQFETTSMEEFFKKGLWGYESLGEHSWFKKYANSNVELLYSELKELLQEWVEAKDSMVIANLFRLYDDFKSATLFKGIEKNKLSFDDLALVAHLLLSSQEREYVYFKLDSKFKHILIDEFQDTSILQFLLFKPLIEEIFAGKGQNEFKSFFYVGDTKQSLYRFRGGIEELFNEVARLYPIEIDKMNTNYRSSKSVVEFVNATFEGRMQGYVKQLSREDATQGFVQLHQSDEVITKAVEVAQNLIENGANVSDIAFLVFTNNDGLLMQNELLKHKIPNILQTSSSLDKLPNIAAIVAMVEYLFYNNAIDAKALALKYKIENFDRSWYYHGLEPFSVCHRLVDIFGCFHHDPNVLKLLEFAASFNDIPSFLEEFYTASIAISSKVDYGAKIITVHGSKGLEFEHVILVDRSTKKPPERSLLLYNYNKNLEIEDIFLRHANRESFDEVYSEAVERKKSLANKDQLNLLYVAMTRAAHSMSIIVKNENSIFEGLDMKPLGAFDISTQTQPIEESVPDFLPIAHYGRQEKENDPQEASSEIDFGNAMHYCLEMLYHFKLESLQSAMDVMVNRFGNLLTQENFDDIERRVKRLIENKDFLELVKGNSYYKEIAIAYEGRLMVIDLLIEKNGAFVVVDYKSSSKNKEEHIAQVSRYIEAIHATTGKAAKGYIFYLLSNEIAIESVV